MSKPEVKNEPKQVVPLVLSGSVGPATETKLPEVIRERVSQKAEESPEREKEREIQIKETRVPKRSRKRNIQSGGIYIIHPRERSLPSSKHGDDFIYHRRDKR